MIASKTANYVWNFTLVLAGLTTGILCSSILMPFRLHKTARDGRAASHLNDGDTDFNGRTLGSRWNESDRTEAAARFQEREYLYRQDEGADSLNLASGDYSLENGTDDGYGYGIEGFEAFEDYDDEDLEFAEYDEYADFMEGVDGEYDYDDGMGGEDDTDFESWERSLQETHGHDAANAWVQLAEGGEAVRGKPAVEGLEKYGWQWEFGDPLHDSSLYTPEVLDDYFEPYEED